MKYDHITEIDKITHVEKFNPYHDERGRFASASGYSSFTFRTKDPSKQHMADMAVARMKERSAAEDANNPENRIASAESSLKAILKDGANVSLKGMDPDCAESVARNAKVVLDKYPSVKDAFGGFSTDSKFGGKENYWSENEGAMACFNSETKMIHFNNEYFGNKGRVESAYHNSTVTKFHPKDTDWESIVTHEMGHAIDLYVSEKTIPWNRFAWNGERVSKRFWNNDINKAKKAGEPMTGTSIRQNLSGYAGSKPAEYLAEGFCEYICSPTPRPTAQSIGKRLETYIRKAEKAGNAE